MKRGFKLLPDEKWVPVPVPGVEGQYVSSMGRLAYRRWLYGRGKEAKYELTVRHASKGPKGYRITSYRKPGAVSSKERKTFMVHLLVLAAFGPPRPRYSRPKHIDGDFSNNRITNLRWETRSR